MSFKKDAGLFFNYIKTSHENKVLFPTKIKYSKFKGFLTILLKYGVIRNFGLYDNRLFIEKNRGIYFEVLSITKEKYISCYKLNSFMAKYPTNIYIISTPLGIYDGKDCAKFNLGGYLLFVIKMENSLSF